MDSKVNALDKVLKDTLEEREELLAAVKANEGRQQAMQDEIFGLHAEKQNMIERMLKMQEEMEGYRKAALKVTQEMNFTSQSQAAAKLAREE